MTTFLMGHGGLSADRPKTIVPEGGSITFYTDVDFDLLLTNGMLALQNGDAGNGYRVEGGQPVENYGLEGYTDNQRVRFDTVAMSGLNVVYIGDPVPNNIHLCDGDDTTCGGGRHICGGVFGRLDDLDIVYLACRGWTMRPRSPSVPTAPPVTPNRMTSWTKSRTRSSPPGGGAGPAPLPDGGRPRRRRPGTARLLMNVPVTILYVAVTAPRAAA